MTQNRQSQSNSRNQDREWNEGLNRTNDQGYRSQSGSNDDDTQQQRNSQGSLPRWSQTGGFQGDNFGNRSESNYDQRSNYYGNREFGQGSQRREWDDPYRINDYSSQQPYQNDRNQFRNYDESQYSNRGNDYSQRGSYGSDYQQGQYGSQTGRGYRSGSDSDYRQGNYGQSGEWMQNQGNQSLSNQGLSNQGIGNYGTGNSGSSRGYGNWRGDESSTGVNRQGNLFGSHKGKGPKGYHRSDDRIKEDISDRLSDDSMIDASDIELEVDNGVVSLTGTVESRDIKRRAEDVAESISGVTNVENRLRVSKENASDKDWMSDKENMGDRKGSVNSHPDSKNKKNSLAGAHN